MDSPDNPPGITGTVISMPGERVRVEATPAVTGGVSVAIVTLTSARAIHWADGRDARAADIRSGDVVSVWFRGPARESYPVQADADVVIIRSRSQ